MPKLVYKCDFCDGFFDDKDEAKQHESECLSDPRLKGCWSCKHKNWDYDDWICMINGPVRKSYICPDVLYCSQWEKGNEGNNV